MRRLLIVEDEVRIGQLIRKLIHFDDLQLVMRAGVKGDLLAVADDVEALQIFAVRQTAHILALSGK